MTEALDLINRLKAEIKVLKDDVSFLDKHNDELHAENERLKADHKRACAERDARIATQNFFKSEARKEFAERLKKELSQCQREYRAVLNSEGACAMVIAKTVVINLLAELDGKENGSEKVQKK